MRILFLTNIPTPYRNAFYDSLHDMAIAEGDSLTVLYCARTEPRRHWPYDPSAMRHNHEVMDGIHLQLKKWHTHINVDVISRLNRFQPDVVGIAGAWNTPTMLLALAWCKINGIPAYFWSEGHSAAVLNSHGFIALVRRYVYSTFDGFLVPNSKSAEWARMQGGEGKITLSLPNSIDTSLFALPENTTRQLWRSRLGINHQGVILIQVARLDAVKAPIELAEAFLSLPFEYRQRAKLIFVGDGSLIDTLRSRAEASEGSIIITGNVDASRVREWLWASDIFVLNTKRDPNPLSPIEASSASMPILLSHLAGNVKELVDEHVTGWIISNPDSPKNELMHAIDCPSHIRVNMGKNALAHVVSTYDVKTVSKNLLKQLYLMHK